MPWTPPLKGTAGTVITEAWSIANVVNLLNWLRGMTGNADPPATNYVVVSDTTSTTSWRKVPGDALAAGAVITHLGYTPVKLTGDTMTGNLVIQAAGAPAQGFTLFGNSGSVYVGFNASQLVLAGAGVVIPQGGLTVEQQIQANHGLLSLDNPQVRAAGDPAQGFTIYGNAGTNFVGFNGVEIVTNTGKIWTNGNDGTASGLDADLWRGNTPAAITVGNATQVGGRTPVASRTANAIPIADSAGSLDAWITGGAIPGPHTHSGDALLPASLNGAPTSSTPGAGRIPIANASGLLDDWVTPSVVGATVPSGLIAIWSTGTPPSGWVFETTYTGRFVIAAQAGAYPLGTTGGASSYDHSINIAHGHADTLGFSGAVGADGSTPIKVTVVTPGDANAAQSGHSHGFTPSKSGAVTALANPTNLTTGAIGHLPPYIALNYVRKS